MGRGLQQRRGVLVQSFPAFVLLLIMGVALRALSLAEGPTLTLPGLLLALGLGAVLLIKGGR